MAVLVELTDRDSLVKSASTSLNNKVVSQYSTLLAPMAVDAVLSAAIGIYGEEGGRRRSKRWPSSVMTLTSRSQSTTSPPSVARQSI
ncbi:hypothetical protein EV1_027170 [Malus domestica]